MIVIAKKARSEIWNVLLVVAIIFLFALAAGYLLESAIHVENFALSESYGSSVERSLKIDKVVAFDEKFNLAIDKTHIYISLVPGSSEISLADLNIVVNSKISEQNLNFSSDFDCSDENYLNFGVVSVDSNLDQGDNLIICLNNLVEIPANSEYSVRIDVKDGSSAFVKLKTPEVIYPSENILYPN